MLNTVLQEIINFSQNKFILIPLGFIGIFRWSVWLIKQIPALFYKPYEANENREHTVSIITPVYNETPAILHRAVQSWLRAKPNEIIAVVDHTDKSSIEILNKYAEKFPEIRVEITEIVGKRGCLHWGMKMCTSDIMALVDADVIWADNVMDNCLAPFRDANIGGVMAAQNIYQPENIAGKLMDMHLDSRNALEGPFLSKFGQTLSCLSGRTSFYRRDAVKNNLDDLVNDHFMGIKQISGDDKGMTNILHKLGYNTYFQSNANIYTESPESIPFYLKQRLRWARNGWRYAFIAFKDKWIYKRPFLFLLYIDRFLSSFFLILGLFLVTLELIKGNFKILLIVIPWYLYLYT